MNISQPTLSAEIKQLEAQLGVLLAFRGSRFAQPATSVTGLTDDMGYMFPFLFCLAVAVAAVDPVDDAVAFSASPSAPVRGRLISVLQALLCTAALTRRLTGTPIG